MYLVVEHYIANSKNEMIINHIKNKEQLEYSIQKENKNGKEYTVIGIGHIFEHKVNTLQWLYYEQEYHLPILYEYDLANDKLVEFK